MKRLLLCSVLVHSHLLFGGESLDTNELMRVLRTMPPPEIPKFTADLIRFSGPRDQIACASNLVQLVLRLNPSATLPVVGAVARAVPETAAAISHVAAKERPDAAAWIAGAAVDAAPNRAGAVVFAVCSAVPHQTRAIALAAHRAAPGQAEPILKAVAEARPDLRPSLISELAAARHGGISVTHSLEQAERALAFSAEASRRSTNSGTVHQGPPDRRPNPPGHQGPPRGPPDPPGGRNYARP
ncbi:MAG TPA: hypothetical protein VKY92_19475 [Verrucomicrobiae bacterium]|nr:hypothetical protein [Verrucomicrobiae bacterium]